MLTIPSDTIRIDFEDGSAAWAYKMPNGTRYASAGPGADQAIKELWRTRDGFIKLAQAEVVPGGEAKKPNLLPAIQRLFAKSLKGKQVAD